MLSLTVAEDYGSTKVPSLYGNTLPYKLIEIDKSRTSTENYLRDAANIISYPIKLRPFRFTSLKNIYSPQKTMENKQYPIQLMIRASNYRKAKLRATLNDLWDNYIEQTKELASILMTIADNFLSIDEDTITNIENNLHWIRAKLNADTNISHISKYQKEKLQNIYLDIGEAVSIIIIQNAYIKACNCK